MAMDEFDLLAAFDELLDDLDDDDENEGEADEIDVVGARTVTSQAGRIFDAETGPLPDEQLKSVFVEKTFKDFSDDCDARWKEETKRAKYDEYRATAWTKFVERAALSPLTGQILAIGYLDESGSKIVGEKGSEVALLTDFWGQYEECRQADRLMIGFNIFFFDLPFFIRRSWILGVDIPATVVRDNHHWDRVVFVDLMKKWQCGVPREMVSLDKLARALGAGNKPTDGTTGADFARLWKEDRAKAMAYLRNDLVMTKNVAKALGVFV